MTEIYTHELSNGLTLLAEPIAGVRSLAMTLLTPAGVISEADDKSGLTSLVSEMICRGAGDLDARGHSDALDQLGIDRGTSAESRYLRLSATMLADKAADALPLLTDMILRPALPDNGLEPSRDLTLQTLDAIEDEPQHKVFIQLRNRHYPAPLNRSPYGERSAVESITLDDVRDFCRAGFVPGGAVLAFAGQFDWPTLRDHVQRTLGDWTGTRDEPTIAADDTAPRGYDHVKAESSQVHIGIAYDAPSEPDERSMLQRAATAVLAGGMSGRLFTEVREKRGLCYAVNASYAGQKDRGAMFSYAGTTVPRAQETLDVLVGELQRISDGIAQDEFDRAIVGMKSRLVMQGESTGARASAIAGDQVMVGRPRTLDEMAGKVDAITLRALNDHVAASRPDRMTIVTVGPDALTPPV